MILVHRFTFPIRDVIELLLDASPEADRWQLRVEGDELVVDIVGPQPATEAPERAPASDRPVAPEASERPPAATLPGKDEADEPKGGKMARDAGKLCGDKLFQGWIEAKDKDHAADIVRRMCGVTSRAMLDHDEIAAEKWREIDRLYAAWMNGDDDAVMPANEEMVL